MKDIKKCNTNNSVMGIFNLCTIYSLINSVKTATQRPHVDTFISGTSVQCLLDTGAEVSILSDRQYRQIPIDKRPARLPGEDPKLGAANGTLLKTKGRFIMPIELMGRTLWHEIIVVENLNGGGILGADFINKHGLTYDGRSRAVSFNSNHIKNDRGNLTLSKSTFLKAGQSKVLSVHATSDVDPFTVITTNTECRESPAVTGLPGVAQLSSNRSCKIQVFNSALVDVTLPRGQVCGNFEVLSPELLAHGFPLDPAAVNEVVRREAQKHPAPAAATKIDREFINANVQLNVPPEWEEAYKAVLYEFHDVFSRDKNDLGVATGLKHEIQVNTKEPVYRKQFKIPDAHREIMEKQVKEWLSLGVVQPSRSRWNSPMFCVPKKDGSLRMVQDFRALNQVSLDDKYSMRDVTECIGELGRAGSTLFSTLDLTSGFWQMLLEPTSRKYTAFTVPGMGQFEWRTSPMGLLGCPASFQRLVEMVLYGIKNVIIYIDDLLVHSASHEHHIKILREMFQRLREHRLKVNLKKCVFGAKDVAYLGFRLTPAGVKPGADKLKAIKHAPPPNSVKQVRGFLGLCNFFRSHVKNFALISHPLTKLTTKDCGWRGGVLPEEALAAFQELKSILISEPVMAYPRQNRPYAVVVDAATGDANNPGGLGAILMQLNEQNQYVALAYASRKLDKHERNYSPFLLEMQAATWAMDHFRTHLLGRKFILYSDHKPLEKLNVQHTKTLNRLQLKATEFNFVIKYKKGSEMPADFLSRNVVEKIEIQAINTKQNTQDSTTTTPPLILDRCQMIKLQKEDPFIADLYQVLTKQSIPPPREAMTKAQISARERYLFHVANTSFVERGLVYRREAQKENERVLLIVPNGLKDSLLAEAHGSLLSGHGGVFKTKQRLLQTYWWPNMDLDISKHIQLCHKCIVTQKETGEAPVIVNTLPQCTAPNQRVHMDLFGPLRTSHASKHYVLALTDAFTKYVELVALPNKEAETLAQAVFDKWICRFGCMLELTCDNSKENRSKIVKSLAEHFKIEQHFTTPFHPQCNAQVEIVNKTIAKYLRSFVDDTTLDWEIYLMPLMFAYNTSVHSATKLSPHEVTFGLPARTPVFLPTEQFQHFYGESPADDLLRRMQQVRQLATANNMAYRDNYLLQANKHTAPHRYHVHQFVYLKQGPALGTNPKLSAQFTGPHQILRLIFDTDVELLLNNGRRTIVHVSRLKPAPDCPAPKVGRGISQNNSPKNLQNDTTVEEETNNEDTPTEMSKVKGSAGTTAATDSPNLPDHTEQQHRQSKKEEKNLHGPLRRSKRIQGQAPERLEISSVTRVSAINQPTNQGSTTTIKERKKGEQTTVMSDPPALSSNNTVAVNTLSPDLRAALVAQALKDLSPNPSGNNTLHYKSWRDTNPTPPYLNPSPLSNSRTPDSNPFPTARGWAPTPRPRTRDRPDVTAEQREELRVERDRLRKQRQKIAEQSEKLENERQSLIREKIALQEQAALDKQKFQRQLEKRYQDWERRTVTNFEQQLHRARTERATQLEEGIISQQRAWEIDFKRWTEQQRQQIHQEKEELQKIAKELALEKTAVKSAAEQLHSQVTSVADTAEKQRQFHLWLLDKEAELVGPEGGPASEAVLTLEERKRWPSPPGFDNTDELLASIQEQVESIDISKGEAEEQTTVPDPTVSNHPSVSDPILAGGFERTTSPTFTNKIRGWFHTLTDRKWGSASTIFIPTEQSTKIPGLNTTDIALLDQETAPGESSQDEVRPSAPRQPSRSSPTSSPPPSYPGARSKPGEDGDSTGGLALQPPLKKRAPPPPIGAPMAAKLSMGVPDEGGVDNPAVLSDSSF